MLINSGEDANSGILVFAAEGDFDAPGFDAQDLLVDAIFGKGWDFDPQSTFSHADPLSKRLVDVNGDGRDDIIASSVGANSSSGDEIVYLLGNVDQGFPGDFNSDGAVDLADYATWRDALGSTSFLFGNGVNDGIVDIHNYDLWRANYGAVRNPPRITDVTPEPTGLLLATVATAALGCWSRT